MNEYHRNCILKSLWSDIPIKERIGENWNVALIRGNHEVKCFENTIGNVLIIQLIDLRWTSAFVWSLWI